MNLCCRFVISPVVLSLALALAIVNTAPAETFKLESDEQLSWYKGNMHTHSHWSDGDDYLEMIALWYQKHDYNFLVFTDHNVLANTDRWVSVKKSKGGATAYGKLKVKYPNLVEERITEKGDLEVRLSRFNEITERFNKAGKYLLIQGEEISDRYEKMGIHLNVSNVVDVIPPMTGTGVFETIQSNVRAVIAQRERTGQPMLVHLNHPNYQFGVTAEDLMRVVGEQFFEVYNGHPGVRNEGDEHHAGTERMWDIINTWRLVDLDLPMMFGLGTDDGHNYHEKVPSRRAVTGRGWVEVLADELTPEALIESLEAGRFYASSGVSLKSVQATDKSLAVEVEAVKGETYTIEFIGTRKGFDRTSEPVLDDEGKEIRATRRYSADLGETLATVTGDQAEYKFQGDELYVRARVTASVKHPNPSELGEFKRAWCQPIRGPAAE